MLSIIRKHKNWISAKCWLKALRRSAYIKNSNKRRARQQIDSLWVQVSSIHTIPKTKTVRGSLNLHVFHRQLAHHVSGPRYQSGKIAHLAHSDLYQAKKKRAPGSLRPNSDTKQNKKERELGPNSYQATKLHVRQLTVKQAKNKIHTYPHRSFVEQRMYEQYSGPLPSIEELYRSWLFLLEDNLFKTNSNTFHFYWKSVFLVSNFWSRYLKSRSSTTYTFFTISCHTAYLAWET